MSPETKAHLRLLCKTAGEFWCEASVLVLVFSLLDKFLKLETLPSGSWSLVTLDVTMVCFSGGTLLKIWAKK